MESRTGKNQRKRLLITLITLCLSFPACHFVTTGDLANLRKQIRGDVKEEVTEAKDEVRSQIKEQSKVQSEQITNTGQILLGAAKAQADQVERVQNVVEERIPEHHSLAGKILVAPWWIRGVLGMLISITISLMLFVILKWNEVRLKWITRDEAGALTLVETIIQRILSRRPDPLAEPDPPEDDKPNLRIVR